MARTLPGTLEMVTELVGLESVSSLDPAIDRPNRPVVERLAGWAESLGFRAELLDVPGTGGRKANLVATLGRGPGGLVLAGHTDTVPFDDGRWSSDPFRATERDGRLYGLGTTDMKSFLALALEAASAFRAGDLRAPIVVLGTADEETTMSGARALQAAGLPEPGGGGLRRAVVGEPTSLRPMRAHKGITMESVVLVGRSGHSSNPALGASALDGMADVLQALVAFRERLAGAHRDDTFEVPVPTLNLGVIHGGDAANRICARCELQVDLRPVPGLSVADARAALRDVVARAVAGRDLEVAHRTLFEGVDAFRTAETADLVRAAESLTGHAAGAVGFGTEAPFFDAMGMETLVLGPGSIDVAHQPDEYLPLDAVDPTIRLLRALITRYCVDDAPGT